MTPILMVSCAAAGVAIANAAAAAATTAMMNRTICIVSPYGP
jgi:hypothetical protein